MARITIANNMETSTTPGSVIVTDINNEQQYLAPPSAVAHLGKDYAGNTGYISKSYACKLFNNLVLSNVNQVMTFSASYFSVNPGEIVGNTFVASRNGIYEFKLTLTASVAGGATNDTVHVEGFVNAILTFGFNHNVGYASGLGQSIAYNIALVLIAGDIVHFEARRFLVPGTITLTAPCHLIVESKD